MVGMFSLWFFSTCYILGSWVGQQFPGLVCLVGMFMIYQGFPACVVSLCILHIDWWWNASKFCSITLLSKYPWLRAVKEYSLYNSLVHFCHCFHVYSFCCQNFPNSPPGYPCSLDISINPWNHYFFFSKTWPGYLNSLTCFIGVPLTANAVLATIILFMTSVYLSVFHLVHSLHHFDSW
jgi:hypothetical protein